MNFNILQEAIQKQFQTMQKYRLFRVGLDKDRLWNIYLSSFPEGKNPIFKVRTGHDCSCCRNFVRTIGDVVAIIGTELVSIWDVIVPDYQAPMDAMSAYVKSNEIADIFLHYTKTVGVAKNFTQIMDRVQTWTHFTVDIDKKFLEKENKIPTILSENRTRRETFVRALNEITDEAVDVVIELIKQGSIYRGSEFLSLVEAFKQSKSNWKEAAGYHKTLLEWCEIKTTGIRNSAIGALLQDISKSVELDKAVASFEEKVAPTNYKRPKSLVTESMIKKARDTIEELGYSSALMRRYATVDDITVNNVIFVNRGLKKNDLFDGLASTKMPNLEKLETVSIENFIKNISPNAESIEVLLENRLTNNLVSLITSANATSKPLFKWPNQFSWSYTGDMTDSIKEKVKSAGGVVDADLCCRLAWFNYDDLDLHLKTPNGEISFIHRRIGGGELDVDMNAGRAQSRTPVENIFYKNVDDIPEGVYTLLVHQYQQRETVDVGFTVEIDFKGAVTKFTYDKMVKGAIAVCTFKYTKANGFEILTSLPTIETQKIAWNLMTQTFHETSMIMLSPNYWDGKEIGNKHYFFMLKDCKNDGSARGFYNEFLCSDLDKHRKVLEVAGNKLRIEGDNQLSGLGFSSTQRNHIVCRVKGKFSRIVKITF